MNTSATVSIYCFPYAGGGASTYRSWQAILPIGIRVNPCQLPGREERFSEEPLSSLEAILEHVCEEVLPTVSAPYALFGHSMGALVAYELCQEIRRRGGPQPNHLFVSGMGAPQQLCMESPLVHQSTDEELLNHIQRLGGISSELLQDREMQSLFVPLLRADLRVSETYQYQHAPPLSCPISAWGGADDFLTSAESLDAWRERTSSSFRLRILPGKHQFINTARSELLRGVQEDLRTTMWEAP